ncbi:MAG TPA: glycosyltransferase family 39 protein [Pararhizobium sp.]|nr:glycosyltransferase family 39 protein [Pararhizobium sp.]
MISTGSKHGHLRPIQYVLLVIICLAAFLPGISSLPPTDRDEARFVQATHQMVETGNYIDIHFQNRTRYKKPVGIYWLQSAAVAVSGYGADAPIWVYRLVSVAGATLAVIGVGWLGAWLFGGMAGFLAAVVQAAILMLAFEGRIAKTDAFLLATVVFAQAALATLWVRAREERPSGWAAPLTFWFATGVGIMIKGPMTPLVSLLTVLSLSLFYRQWAWLKRLKPAAGIAIVVVLAAPWLILITLKSGGAFWSQSVGKDLMGKVAGAAESHGAPPGFYALIFVLFMWPFGLMALRGGLSIVTRFRADPRLAFLVAWYVPYWIVVEALPTKLPQYILPAYPAIVLALAWALQSGYLDTPFERRWQRWLEWLTFAGHVVATLAIAALAVGLPTWLTGRFSWAGAAVAVTALIAGTFASGRLMQGEFRRALFFSAGAAIVTFGLLMTFVVPSLTPVWLSPAITRAYEAHRPCPDSRLASAGYNEPSLVFLAGTDTFLTDGTGAADYLVSHRACGIAAVTNREKKDFLSALSAHGAAAQPVETIHGINYSKGRRLAITFYTLAGK